MASTNTTTTTTTTTTTASQPPPAIDVMSAEELAAKNVNKRYEGLVMIRTKAVRGKGAWYWAHLEPLLIHSTDTGLPKAVKLRCSLCESIFSASNPSRTASEHLKRGTCPNFASAPKPISSVAPAISQLPSSPPPGGHRHRKRHNSGSARSQYCHSQSPSPISVVDPSRFCLETAAVPHQQLILSGGKEDLGALAMLEDSVKKLKSPKTSPGPALNKAQIDFALDCLADWVYDSCGSVSISSLEHPKFKAFLHQVGMPPVSKRDFAGPRLDAKYEESRAESEARIRDAMFFQIASDGWGGEDNLVNVSVNLPNGTSLYRRALFVTGPASSGYAEDVLWESIAGICGNSVQRCVGIVADRFKAKALRNLESQHNWMVNLPCQVKAFSRLVRDFSRELPLFETVSRNCSKLARLVNDNPRIRKSFVKYQLQEFGHSSGALCFSNKKTEFGPLECAMVEDVLSYGRPLQMAIMDESNKAEIVEDPAAAEAAVMVKDMGFWNEVEAVNALVKLIKETAQEIEAERPLIGQCLPLWEELRAKVKDWCAKFRVPAGPAEKAVDRRFWKNYHPAWAAAFVLDPLYLVRDTTGKYLPPFKRLTTEQEKDVDQLITRLVSRDEAHIALMELMKWRTTGLDPVYARAVQMKERDPVTGKLRIVNPQSSRLVWETHLSEFRSLGKVAVRLIFLRAVSSGFKCNSSYARWIASTAHGQSNIASVERAQKLIFIAAHSKLERRDFSSDEDKDAELFGLANGEDDVLNEVLVDAS